jgi:hypothetical protein
LFPRLEVGAGLHLDAQTVVGLDVMAGPLHTGPVRAERLVDEELREQTASVVDLEVWHGEPPEVDDGGAGQPGDRLVPT